ncbi:hypothetical protein EJ04DRAFT_558922 [Polyplosphaeria fusca]|uniref:Complex 1 LYR protein domain-containing protein n=1 Tax=Polyplosphaeria fusca TaxID=682080 RepID=A0A9P4RBU3_9PLEO|nr:hypothetical protein EJ04DRAFT_558922 [Polyplosphaeria fusca]
MAKISGLQREVLSLYRQCLRACRKKPADTRLNFYNHTRSEFHRNSSINKKDFGTIEYLIRSGRKKLETYEDPGIRNIANL